MLKGDPPGDGTQKVTECEGSRDGNDAMCLWLAVVRRPTQSPPKESVSQHAAFAVLNLTDLRKAGVPFSALGGGSTGARRCSLPERLDSGLDMDGYFEDGDGLQGSPLFDMS